MKSDILSTNAEYAANKGNWRLVRDLMKGESALKEHDLTAARKAAATTDRLSTFKLNERYLPMPDAANCEEKNLLRYAQYVQRASLFNATKRTEQGISGMVFSKPAQVELPTGIEYLEYDADGSGVGLEQQSSEVLNDVIETGRSGLLVDYPNLDRPATQAEAEQGAARAAICVYKAEAILDWDCERKGSKHVLSFVKLKEKTCSRDEIFSIQEKEQIRVLRLNESGQYEVQLFKEGNEMPEVYVPNDSNGRPFDYIPFFFIGSVNNRPNVDVSPLIELAEVNLAHYRNSADFEESAFVTGQPTLALTGLNQTWANQFMSEGIAFGARGAILLPEGGSASLLQCQPNTMPEAGMTRKERQMVELGARLVQPGGQAETAEAARIKHASDASVLSVIVRNINSAYVDAIEACQQFNGGTGEFTYKLNDDFFTSKMTAEELRELVSAWQQGAISKSVLDRKLVAGGVIDDEVDLEIMNDEISEAIVTTQFD